jgi:hypothetical protein
VAFVATDVQEWGRFNAADNSAERRDEPEPGDQDLLDFVALRTYLNSGSVHVLALDEMPDTSPVSTLYRY